MRRVLVLLKPTIYIPCEMCCTTLVRSSTRFMSYIKSTSPSSARQHPAPQFKSSPVTQEKFREELVQIQEFEKQLITLVQSNQFSKVLDLYNQKLDSASNPIITHPMLNYVAIALFYQNPEQFSISKFNSEIVSRTERNELHFNSISQFISHLILSQTYFSNCSTIQLSQPIIGLDVQQRVQAILSEIKKSFPKLTVVIGNIIMKCLLENCYEILKREQNEQLYRLNEKEHKLELQQSVKTLQKETELLSVTMEEFVEIISRNQESLQQADFSTPKPLRDDDLVFQKKLQLVSLITHYMKFYYFSNSKINCGLIQFFLHHHIFVEKEVLTTTIENFVEGLRKTRSVFSPFYIILLAKLCIISGLQETAINILLNKNYNFWMQDEKWTPHMLQNALNEFLHLYRQNQSNDQILETLFQIAQKMNLKLADESLNLFIWLFSVNGKPFRSIQLFQKWMQDTENASKRPILQHLSHAQEIIYCYLQFGQHKKAFDLIKEVGVNNFVAMQCFKSLLKQRNVTLQQVFEWMDILPQNKLSLPFSDAMYICSECTSKQLVKTEEEWLQILNKMKQIGFVETNNSKKDLEWMNTYSLLLDQLQKSPMVDEKIATLLRKEYLKSIQ